MTGVGTETAGTATNAVTTDPATGMAITDIGIIAKAIGDTAMDITIRGLYSNFTSVKRRSNV